MRRSTIGDANKKRTPEVFAEALQLLLTQVKRSVRSQVKEMLCLLDSTSSLSDLT